MASPEPWVPFPRLKEHSGLSASSLYHRMKEIPHARIGTKLLFKLSAYDKWVQDQNENTVADGNGNEETSDKDVETTIPPTS